MDRGNDSRQAQLTTENPDIKVTLHNLGQKNNHTAHIFKWPKNPQAVLPVKPLSKKSRLLGSPFFILIMLTIVLLCAAILLWWLHTRYSLPTAPLTLPQSTPTLRAVSPESIVAFSKYNDASSSALLLYDIIQKRKIPVTVPLAAERDGLVALGPWSPDGKYLPILIIRGSNFPNPLYWYDTLDGLARLIVDARSKPDLLSGVASFNYLSRWLQNDIMVFNLRASPEENSDELVLVSSSGEVSRVSRPSKLIHGNRHLDISVPLATVGSSPSAVARKIKFNGKEITFDFTGEIIGIVNETLVTLESPHIPELDQLNENKSLTTSLNRAADESEAEELLEQALRPTGDWYLHIYKLVDGSLINSISLTDDRWLTIQAQIRPQRGTVIIHQQDGQLPPFTTRYIEIDVNKLDKKRIVAEGPGELSEERIFGNSFYLTADGDWLISYAPAEDLQAYPLGKTIIAWRIDTGEKLILCEDACDQIRVYNPEDLRLK